MPQGAILVVDDNCDQAHVLAQLLRLMDYEVVTAHNAEQGLALLRVRRFCAVFTDHHMPGKTGCAMLTEAKAAGCSSAPAHSCSRRRRDAVVGWRALSKLSDVRVLLAELETLDVEP